MFACVSFDVYKVVISLLVKHSKIFYYRMDKDGHRRYFIVGSVILEVVTPLLRNRFEEKYLNSGFPTLKDIKIDDLDVTMALIILLNCCNLGQDVPFVENLRQCIENFLTHHITKAINQTEYSSYWSTLVANDLQLDDTKKDEIKRIEQRQVDEEQMNLLNTNLDEVYFVRDLHRLNF